MIHRHTEGFWEHHVAYPLEQHIIQCLWDHYFPEVTHGVILNTTYIDPDLRWIKDIIRNNRVDAILLTSLVDPVASDLHQNLCELSGNNPHIRIQLAGYCNHYFPNYDYVDFWALFMERHFQQYTDEQLMPTHLKHVFLSYNRKPHRHRVYLYESIHGNAQNCVDVSDLGLITLGNTVNERGHPTHQYDVVSFPDNTTGITDHEDLGDDAYGISGTATALGNLTVWRESFLSVIAETTSEIDHRIPFVSEKTYKSILGLRPFVTHGDSGYNRYLISNGYRTFTDRLGMDEIFGVEKLNQAILRLSEQNLDDLYTEWLPDIMHNRENFYQHCRRIRHKFNITYIDKHS